MNALLLLIPIALFLGLLGLAAFMWAMRTGQFDDPDGAANRILFDDLADGRAGGVAVAPDRPSERPAGELR